MQNRHWSYTGSLMLDYILRSFNTKHLAFKYRLHHICWQFQRQFSHVSAFWMYVISLLLTLCITCTLSYIISVVNANKIDTMIETRTATFIDWNWMQTKCEQCEIFSNEEIHCSKDPVRISYFLNIEKLPVVERSIKRTFDVFAVLYY